jgi:hypothetical protein
MTVQDYEELARKVEYVNSLVAEVNATADALRVPIPQSLARGMADLLVFPAEIRQVGARRAGMWVEPIMERADEPPPDPEDQ